MQTVSKGPDIEKSALLIVDMQNDFLHRDGSFSHFARENPEAKIAANCSITRSGSTPPRARI